MTVERDNAPAQKGTEIIWPSRLRKHAEVAQQIANECREGKYLSMEKLFDLAPLDEKSYVGWNRDMYLHNIFNHSSDAIAHLCLPSTYHFYLIVGGIETLSSLDEAIEAKSLSKLEDVGKKTAERITHIYEEWKNLPDLDDANSEP